MRYITCRNADFTACYQIGNTDFQGGAWILGLSETIKHFKGEGTCCGGGSTKPKKKKLKGKVVCTYSFYIDGMHCSNCANAVTGAINDIDGAVAKVSLNKKMAKVSCDREIDVLAIEEAIRKRGYEAALMK